MSSDAERAATQETGPVIDARGLEKTYRVYARPRDRLKQMLWPGRRRFGVPVHALRGVDLEVHRGETVGVVGRNGSGKSTLLRLVCGTLDPTAGALRVRGNVAPILTIGAGFNPEFTGRENVLLNASVLGLPDARIRERLAAIAEFADIGDFFDRPVRLYSTGMYARLAFAVAIHTDPDVLVIDETLAVGDEAFARKCFARIEAIKERGATILFASHSPLHILELCDRALLMEGGERLLTGSPKTVMAHYHKLLYAAPAEQRAAAQRARDVDAGRGEPARSDGSGGGEEASPRAGEAEAEAEEDLGSYDAGLVAESRLEYEPAGARIEGPRILDPKGREVNVLRSEQVYTYAYDVEFTRPAFGVRFGMMIKLVTGLELAGQASHPRGTGLAVAAGSRARVRFPFQPRLVPGTYFLNAGVTDGELNYLHRVVDALAFRIDPDRQSRVTGRVDLSAGSGTEVALEAALSAPPPARSRNQSEPAPGPLISAARSSSSN